MGAVEADSCACAEPGRDGVVACEVEFAFCSDSGVLDGVMVRVVVKLWVGVIPDVAYNGCVAAGRDGET